MEDLLTAYNGQNITYDQIGNPLTYYNGTTFTWNYGRKLATATTADGTNISYKYNDGGIRTQKTVNGVTTDYFLDGSTIIAQKTGNNTTWYYYDGDGTREAIEYGGNVYYYFYNAQGDVVGLFDNNLNVVVEYTYDSWGNVLSITGSLASTLGQDNPFRYRGYYFDSDTGLYYLNSRYYDANTGRFINADEYDLVLMSPESANDDKNLFAYCDNNPVSRADSSGEIWHIAAGAVIGGGFEIANQLLSGKSLSELNWAKIGIATASGGLTAALGPLSGAFVSGLTNVALDAIDGKRGATLMRSFASGAAISLIGSGIGKATEKIGGKIAVKQLSKLSKSKVKSKITHLYPSISGKERNAVKNISYLTRNYKDVGSRLLGKTIPTVFSQTSEGLIGIGINRFNTRCRLW